MRLKENTLSTSTIQNSTPQCGTYSIAKVPKLLPYPKPLLFESEGQLIKNLLCYVIEHYDYDGISLLVYRIPNNNDIYVVCGDWNGNAVDLTAQTEQSSLANLLIEQKLVDILSIMRYAKIDQAQYFFNYVENKFVLVDMQVALNKFAGPGMLRDVFGRTFDIPKIKHIGVIDDVTFDAVTHGSGTYSGDVIIKPSKFRLHETESGYVPLYVELKR